MDMSIDLNMKYYAGIGSRETPEELRPLIQEIVKLLDFKGYVLRSGGAHGADEMFESSATRKQIFLPWRGFNKNNSPLFNISDEALEMAKEFHPAPDKLSASVLKLMARNVYQVLGEDLKTPVSFVICYTKDGKDTGGTGQAIRIATKYNIPVYNLHNKGFRDLDFYHIL